MDADIPAAGSGVLGASEASSNRSPSSVINGQGRTDKADNALWLRPCIYSGRHLGEEEHLSHSLSLSVSVCLGLPVLMTKTLNERVIRKWVVAFRCCFGDSWPIWRLKFLWKGTRNRSSEYYLNLRTRNTDHWLENSFIYWGDNMVTVPTRELRYLELTSWIFSHKGLIVKFLETYESGIVKTVVLFATCMGSGTVGLGGVDPVVLTTCEKSAFPMWNLGIPNKA